MVDGGIDFITLDNASPDQFDAAQLRWLHKVIAADEGSKEVKTILVGMHAALPGSVGRSHSMNDWAQGLQSGNDVYEAFLHAQNIAGKHVYIVASHSHFYMKRVYDTRIGKVKSFPDGSSGRRAQSVISCLRRLNRPTTQ